MRKSPEDGFIQAQVVVNGRQADLAIDGKTLSIPLEGAPEEAREAVRRRLVLTARLRRMPIRAAIAEPDRSRAIIIHPDGEIEDAEQQDDDRKSRPAPLPAEMRTEPDGARSAGAGRAIRKAGAALLAAAILTAAGIGVYRMIERGQEAARKQAYQTCMQARKDTAKTFGRTLRTEYASALNVTADQVEDPSAVSRLHRLMDSIDGRIPLKNCNPQDTKTGLGQAEAGMRRSIGSREKLYEAVARAAKAVLASRDAKALDDAKAALEAKKSEASRLLADSDGKVADNAARDGLQQAISQAGQAKGGKAKAYQDAAAALQAAIDQVNASVQAKSQADQQAAQAQAQAAQQPTPQQGAGHGSGRAPARHPAGGGSKPPASSQNSRPSAPSAPQGGWSVPPVTNDDNTLPDHL